MSRRTSHGIDLSSILRKNDQLIGQQKSALPLSLKRKEWQKRCIDKRQPFAFTVNTIGSWIHIFFYSGLTSRQTKVPTLAYAETQSPASSSKNKGDMCNHCFKFTTPQSLSFLYIASPQQGDLRLSGPPSGQGASSGARTRDRRVPADLRATTP
ncbi:hypothetical protein PoB_005035100 [Plakobranchus ocellatus]|uniref:Uncharacterized protein n=1 Tax=Plakobranchus ocellatus TaxID=259542 RepID=A0AAV4BKK4_9GAST|nr:hypothetical protein PoB_005035100 [Plakobranchus ocellatus]